MTDRWDKVFKSEPSKFCGRQPLKNFKIYDLLKQTISLEISQRLSSRNLLSPLLNTLPQIILWNEAFKISWDSGIIL